MNRQLAIGLVIVVSFVLGAAAMWGYRQQLPAALEPESAFLDGVFDDHFFDRSRSPFEEMSRIQEEMDRMFERHDRMLGFDRWFGDRYGNFPVSGITSREDDDYLYYVLDVEGKDVANVDITTADGYVTIQAELTEASGGFSSSTTINQRFPIPAGVNQTSGEILHEGDEILVRFSKKG